MQNLRLRLHFDLPYDKPDHARKATDITELKFEQGCLTDIDFEKWEEYADAFD